MRKKEGFIVIDYGTSKIHVNVIDICDGSLLANESELYGWISRYPNWFEIDPEKIWEVSEKAVGKIVKSDTYDVVGLSFSFMGDNIFPVDKAGNALTNVMVAIDNRASDEEERFFSYFGDGNIKRITGNPKLPGLVPGKIMWIKDNMPEITAKTARYVTLHEYIMFRLGFGYRMDRTSACRKALMDENCNNWSGEMCEYLGIDCMQLGNCGEFANTVLGSINSFGKVKLPHSISVVMGAHDAECGAIGLGCSEKNGILGNITGTFEHVLGFSSKFYGGPAEITSYSALVDGEYVLMAGMEAGPYLDWVSEKVIGMSLRRAFDGVSFDGTNSIIVKGNIGRNSLSFEKLGFDTDRFAIFGGIVEKITFDLLEKYRLIQQCADIEYHTLRIGGGSANSEKWSQFKADVFKLRTEVVSNNEISSVGAAIIGTVSLGIYSDYAEASAKMISIKREMLPNLQIAERYTKKRR